MLRFLLTLVVLLILTSPTFLNAQTSTRRKSSSIFGIYSTTWGEVRINKSSRKSSISFSISVVHNEGRSCVGELRAYAKLISKDTYRYIEKVDTNLDYGHNVYYSLTFHVNRNKLVIKESAKGNEDATNIHHGSACTFNGSFFKTT